MISLLRKLPAPVKDALVLARYVQHALAGKAGRVCGLDLERAWLKRTFRSPDPWNYERSPIERQRHALVLGVAGASPAHRILDVGCAEGVFTRELARATGAEVVGVDIFPHLLERAAQRCSGMRNVHFRRVDLVREGLPDRFDLAIAMDIFYYFPGTRAVAAARDRIVEALGPGGRIVLEHGLRHAAVEGRFHRIARRFNWSSRGIHALFAEHRELEVVREFEHRLEGEGGWTLLLTELRRKA